MVGYLTGARSGNHQKAIFLYQPGLGYLRNQDQPMIFLNERQAGSRDQMVGAPHVFGNDHSPGSIYGNFA